MDPTPSQLSDAKGYEEIVYAHISLMTIWPFLHACHHFCDEIQRFLDKFYPRRL